MEIIPEPSWTDLLSSLKECKGISIIIGPTDSGKSTLAKYLIENLLIDNHTICLIDSDIGQSSFGLPGTISKKTFYKPEDLNDFAPENMSFIGTFNPSNKIPLMIEMTKYMIESPSAKGAETIVIDTTGLVDGATGKALKIGKIRAINPDHIIVLQRSYELKHILALVDESKVYQLNVSAHVKTRNKEKRAQYRMKRFIDYFKNSFIIEYPLKNKRLFYKDNKLYDLNKQYLKQGSLLGLNRGKKTIALGILDKIVSDKVSIITPLINHHYINRIDVGEIVFSTVCTTITS